MSNFLGTLECNSAGCQRMQHICWGLCGLTLDPFVVEQWVVVSCVCVENVLLQHMFSLLCCAMTLMTHGT